MQTKTEMQTRILNGFSNTLRNEKYSEPSAVQKLIFESKKNRSIRETRTREFNEKPRISFYNPNNPLNGFTGKTREEQERISLMLKAQDKATRKAAKEALKNESI